MKRVLVTYATFSGSTADTAALIAEEFTSAGLSVDVIPISKALDLSGYDMIILGAPMIMGFYKPALKFLKMNQGHFRDKPLAIFIHSMSLTRNPCGKPINIDMFLDEGLVKDPVKEGHLTLRERYSSVENYLKPILNSAGDANLTSIAFFGGKLSFFHMKWWAIIFVLLVIQAKPMDLRNKDAVRRWSRTLINQWVA